MNKKFLGVAALCVVLVFGAVACSGSSDESSSSSSSSDTASTDAASTEAEQAEKAEKVETDYPTTIDGCKIAEDYEGKPAAVITYTFTNNSDETATALWSVSEKVYQNGVELEQAYGGDWDSTKNSSEIKPGATVTYELAYLLDDESDITVEVKEAFSWSDTLIAEKTFSVK